MIQKRLAIVLLDGCSGCAMALLQNSEEALELNQDVNLIYSTGENREPFPANVDITLVEGAVSNDEDLARIITVRERTRILISLGDCAVAGKSSSAGNPFGVLPVLGLAYTTPEVLRSNSNREDFTRYIPAPRPVHTVVKVDYYIPGCAPDSTLIQYVVGEIAAGRQPEMRDWRRFSA